jgi:AraC family transcriptional regulator
MQEGPSAFGVGNTHGILLNRGHDIRHASDGLGWRSLYASHQREAPYEANFGAIQDHMVILHLDGPVTVERRLGGECERRRIERGGLFILPGGMDFGVHLEGSLETLHLYLRRDVVEEVAEEFACANRYEVEIIPRLGDHDPLIAGLGSAVFDLLRSSDISAPIYVDYLTRALAAQLLTRHSSRQVQKAASAGAGLERGKLKTVMEYIEDNLQEPISLDELAQLCGLSPSQFARRFRASVGKPPHQHLIGARVERAKRLLRKGEPIVEVALSCGFAHQEHLTRIFKRETGCTPAVFRRALVA